MAKDPQQSRYIINTDGASRGNPGHAAAGFTIKSGDGVIWVQEGVYLGILTNNEAEYKAVLLALKRFISDFSNRKPFLLEVMCDSQLVVSQLSGVFKVKNERLRVFYDEIKKLENEIGPVRYLYTPRENNSLADKLANIALDTRLLK